MLRLPPLPCRGWERGRVGAARGHEDGQEQGKVYRYWGSRAGLGLTPAWMARGAVSEGLFGCTLSGPGDVDGDGFGDVVLGGTRLAASSNNVIRAWLFRGRPTGLRTEPDWMFDQSVAFAEPGVTVQALGDVNRDRVADFAVAAWLHKTPGGHEGQVWVFAGSECGPSGLMLRADTPQVARGWYPRPPALPWWR